MKNKYLNRIWHVLYSFFDEEDDLKTIFLFIRILLKNFFHLKFIF